MKTVTLHRNNLGDGMIVLLEANTPFYVCECIHNNDDSTILRGNYTGFHEYPTASHILFDRERVQVVIG